MDDPLVDIVEHCIARCVHGGDSLVACVTYSILRIHILLHNVLLLSEPRLPRIRTRKNIRWLPEPSSDLCETMAHRVVLPFVLADEMVFLDPFRVRSLWFSGLRSRELAASRLWAGGGGWLRVDPSIVGAVVPVDGEEAGVAEAVLAVVTTTDLGRWRRQSGEARIPNGGDGVGRCVGVRLLDVDLGWNPLNGFRRTERLGISNYTGRLWLGELTFFLLARFRR